MRFIAYFMPFIAQHQNVVSDKQDFFIFLFINLSDYGLKWISGDFLFYNFYSI
ncbi:hypothetical protein QE441_002914 [Chryseobacterium sp. SORGH_AS909]|uniref:Uncharacterized protein n=1 Tax=Chryseobacterium camelliae TaxID=1265445 RepID=A0ABU0TFQ0_9FLAO|nr:hypothetical protein [Chryseobacterium camelliae]MDQ1099773.1 hypothetical protein [Chryseobacterium sp. SORGH_AS_1048]MDR6087120.1 hypothetical protein [Chryseobacterium sp. SORGH_AS_0909]MDR6131493.1 hypothetical protein [Chryseobacterium sp. SORGH_AS_1175]MDT3406365.1 hypothetical protein [Pseudacidovorax intermedius]